MKKSFLLLIAVSCMYASDGFAQRTIGTTRDPENNSPGSRNPHGRSGEALPADTPAPPVPPPPCVIYNPPPRPHPPIVVVNPTCSGSLAHETVVIVEERTMYEEPEISSVVLRDYRIAPGSSGFDFSAEEVVRFTDQAVDVYFAIGDEGAEFVVGNDADIQDLGQIDSFVELETIPSSQWSPTHRVHAEPGNVYAVWTWDNQYYKFRVVSISDRRVSFEWMKMDGGSRIQSDVALRNGTDRRNGSLAKFGR